MSLSTIVQHLTECASDLETDYRDDTGLLDREDPANLVAVLVAIRAQRADLATFADVVEGDLVALMEDSAIVVEHVGEVRKRRSVKRTGWDHEALIPAIVGRLADEPGVFFDPESGALLPFQTIGHNVARRLKECVSFGAGKVTGLRAIGIEPEEFCRTEWGKAKIELPARQI